MYICIIQAKFEIGNHLQNFGQVMALYRFLLFVVGVKYKVKILFPLNTFEGMH